MDSLRRIYGPVVPAFDAAAGSSLFRKSAGPRVSPEAVLTYPIKDLQGDVVEPGGIDWTEFNTVNGRLVNVEHGPYIGRAEVEYKSLPILDANKVPDERLGMIRLPVGVTTFFKSAADAAKDAELLRKYDGRGRQVGLYSPDECYQYAEQTYPLVMDGTLSGTSLEFRPRGPENVAYKSLGKSPMLDRDAYHFYQTDAIGFAAACYLPVNPVAGYAAASPETIARAEKAFRLCEKPGTLDVIRKSLRPLTALLKPPSGRVTAPVRRDPMPEGKLPAGARLIPPQGGSGTAPPRRFKKAEMYEDDPMAVGPGEVMEEVDVMRDEDMGDDMKPTPAALFQFAQALKDACAMADDMAARGEHMQGVKALKKFCEQVDGIAAKVTAMAEKVAGAVAGEEVEIDVDADMEADAPPVELDDDGGLMAKSLSAQKWRPIRFVKATPYTLKHLKGKPKAAAGQVVVDAEHLKNLEALAKLAIGQ